MGEALITRRGGAFDLSELQGICGEQSHYDYHDGLMAYSFTVPTSIDMADVKGYICYCTINDTLDTYVSIYSNTGERIINKSEIYHFGSGDVTMGFIGESLTITNRTITVDFMHNSSSPQSPTIGYAILY